ncbi:MAG: hypothetical protein QXE05_07600 [Nitrososphaeria archaeon]
MVTVTVHYRVQELKRGQFLLNLPKIWTRTYKIIKGTILEVQILSDGSLRIVPPKNVGEEGPERAQDKEVA